MNDTRLPRREFFRSVAATAIGATGARWSALPAVAAPPAVVAKPFVGIHIAAHSFYDEGFGHCLDFLHETAGVNALFVTSNSYYGAMFRPKEAQGDHGVPIRDGRGRKVTRLFFKPHEEYYAGTALRHKTPDASLEYAGKEIFADLAEPARRRGMKVYERLYEPGGNTMPALVENWEKVLTIDLFGKPSSKPCWNNPDYLNWVSGSITDLMKSYPLDGIQYGAERNGPLSRLLDWAASVPTCFCDFCRQRAGKEGLDFARAKAGLEAMYQFIQGLVQGKAAGPDGALVGFLQVLMQYPEVLAWEAMHYRASEELHKRIHDAVKAVNPWARVGRHIDHSQTSWDFLFRAGLPYARMTESSEFLKISTYHEILGPRLKGIVTDRYGKHIWQQLTAEQLLQLHYALAGHDKNVEPGLADMDEKGFSPEYVYRETKRAVEGVAGKAAVYAGIALDVPRGGNWGDKPSPSRPDTIYRAVQRAYDAGATGIVICREYEENHRESLQAVGRAVRQRSGQSTQRS